MKISERLKGLHYVQAALVSLAVASFFVIVVPLQTFLGNRDMFEFSMAEVVCEAVPVAVAVWVALAAVLVVAELLVGRLACVVVVALLLCGYFETGLFSVGLPSLDGEIRAFLNPFRFIIDSVLLALVFLATVSLYKWIKGVAHWVALAVLVMGVASLFDARRPEESMSRTDLSDGFCPQLDIVESLRFSPKRNVIVLILDSTPAVIASAAVRENSGVRAHFTGFTAYENNIAMHELTARGLPGLMTGKYLEPDMSASDYVASMFGPDSLLMPYVKAGDPVYFSGGMLSYGYTNRRLGDFSKIEGSLNKSGPVFLRNSSSIPYVTLLDVVKFRIVPYRYKAGVLGQAYTSAIKGSIWKNFASESFTFPLVASHPIGVEDRTTLSILHTIGIHGPITIDRFGNDLPEPTQAVSAHYEYGVYLMEKVGEFLDKLKAKGVYDNSFIVIAADHGLIVLREGGPDADGSKGHGAESSILWVKPIGAVGEMSFSSEPTSNCRIAELVRQAESRDLGREDVDKILYAKERRFLAKHGSTWWSFGRRLFFYEWVYDEDGKLISYENKGVFKAN